MADHDWEEVATPISPPNIDLSSIVQKMRGKSPEEWAQLKQDLDKLGIKNLPPELQMNLDVHTGSTKYNVPPLSKAGESAVSAFEVAGIPGGPQKLKNLGQAVGLDIPDLMMQAAAGVSKVEPGMGNRMIEQGLIGTRGMMGKQAERKIPQMAQELNQAVQGLPGSVSGEQVGQKILEKAKPYMTQGGRTTGAGQEALDIIGQRAAEAQSRGNVPLSEAIELKRILGKEGYRADKPLAGLQKELARTEGGAMKQGVLDAIPDQGVKQQVSDSLANQEAMFKAKRGAERPITLMSLAGLLRGGGSVAAPLLSPAAHAAKAVQSTAGAVEDPLLRLLAKKSSQAPQDSEWEDSEWEEVK